MNGVISVSGLSTSMELGALYRLITERWLSQGVMGENGGADCWTGTNWL
jgi:hypothetical protein